MSKRNKQNYTKYNGNKHAISLTALCVRTEENPFIPAVNIYIRSYTEATISQQYGATETNHETRCQTSNNSMSVT